ncbi:hypothetical protein ACQRB4_07485 [Peptoniphilaceae bacterium SGI.097]
MEKTIDIAGKPTRFVVSGGFLLRYKSLTGKDPIQAIQKMNKISRDNMTIDNMELVYTIFWVAAKTADPSIPDLADWLDSFDQFPIDVVSNEIIPMITTAFQSDLSSKISPIKKKQAMKQK